jgi:hypothetical protein
MLSEDAFVGGRPVLLRKYRFLMRRFSAIQADYFAFLGF